MPDASHLQVMLLMDNKVRSHEKTTVEGKEYLGLCTRAELEAALNHVTQERGTSSRYEPGPRLGATERRQLTEYPRCGSIHWLYNMHRNEDSLHEKALLKRRTCLSDAEQALARMWVPAWDAPDPPDDATADKRRSHGNTAKPHPYALRSATPRTRSRPLEGDQGRRAGGVLEGVIMTTNPKLMPAMRAARL
jgi:hypothetical protein